MSRLQNLFVARHPAPATARRAHRLPLIVAMVAAAVLQACGDDESDPTGPGPVTQIEILGDAGRITALTLAAGSSEEVAVGGLDSRGTDVHGAQITATSSNPSVAIVTQGGSPTSGIRLAHTDFTVQGLAAGTATVTFREVGGATGTLDVTVTP